MLSHKITKGSSTIAVIFHPTTREQTCRNFGTTTWGRNVAYNSVVQKTAVFKAKKIYSSKKKQKVIQRKLSNIEETYKTLSSDYQKYLDLCETENKLKKVTKKINNTNSYVKSEISLHTDILKQEGFIEGEFKVCSYFTKRS